VEGVISPFGVDHGSIAKSHPLAALDATSDGLGKLTSGKPRQRRQVVPPAQAGKIRANIAAVAAEGDRDVNKRQRAAVSKSMAGPLLIGNSSTEDRTPVGKAKTFIPLRDVGRPRTPAKPSVEYTRSVTVPKIRGALAPLKADMIRAAKK
jgi:hypothetical protein